jgi:hypothetical protein
VLDVLEDCEHAYNQATEHGKRLLNQVIFEKIHVNPNGTVKPEYSEIIGLLVNPGIRNALQKIRDKIGYIWVQEVTR